MLAASQARRKADGEDGPCEEAREVGRYDWADPAGPAGASPADGPRWRVAVGLAVWFGWIGFLVFMVMQRLADAST